MTTQNACLPNRIPTWIEKHAPLFSSLALLLAFHLIFRSYFPLPNGRMGHDYLSTLPNLLDGYLWFRQNGFLSPPWFTPSFCGGQPLFADPQSIFYSLPQFLTFITDPLQAAYWSFLFFASVSFWGMYLFSRKNLGSGIAAAIASATIFMFNGFYSTRMIVGHYGYQSITLAPLIASLLIMSPVASPGRDKHDLLFALGAGLLIAYSFHSGMATLLIPLSISVLALICLAQIRCRELLLKPILLRGTLAAFIATGLCASKLSANLSLMSNFTRDYYPLPGIADTRVLAEFVFQSLFYSSEHVYRTVTPYWQNMQWSALPHELAYNLTPLPLVVILLAVARRILKAESEKGLDLSLGFRTIVPVIFLVGITAIPVLLLYYSPAWNSTLKSLPLIGSTTSPFRWMIIYIPLIAAAVAISVDTLGKYKQAGTIILLLGVPGLNYLEQRNFLQNQPFNPAAIVTYYYQIKSGEITPKITAIGNATQNNEQITKGISAAYCYNPLFGYRLEKFRLSPLRPGPIDAITENNSLNLRNPTCLIFPNENHCEKWDAFTKPQAGMLLDFASYHAIDFNKPLRQKIADWITTLTLLATLGIVSIFLFHTLSLKRKK